MDNISSASIWVLLYVHDFWRCLLLRTFCSRMAAPAQQQSKDRTAKRDKHHNVERVREALR